MRPSGFQPRSGRPEHHLALGPALPATVWRHGSPVPQASKSGLAGGRDVRSDLGRWHYIYRAIDGSGQIVDALCLTEPRYGGRTDILRAGSTGTTPRPVITDKAATYPQAVLDVLVGTSLEPPIERPQRVLLSVNYHHTCRADARRGRGK
ncbi:MAG: transposase [Chloroflexi bacterium]|nr:transposase [Chloroflexota bacterium]